MPATLNRSLDIQVAEDRMSAWVTGGGSSRDPRAQILTKLQEFQIPLTERVKERLTEIGRLASTGQLDNKPTLVAEGVKPTPGTPSTIQLSQLEPTTDASETQSADNTSMFAQMISQIRLVQAGDIIGTLIPGKPPCAGTDVFGKPVAAPPPSPGIQLGENVTLREDGQTLVATAAGKVHLNRSEISVQPVETLPNDVEATGGPIHSVNNLLIEGTVREGSAITSDRSITVRKAVEAATLQAGTDIQTNGGIMARGKGKLIAGGQIVSKFCQDADLQAQGDVVILREAFNCRIHTSGRLLMAEGRLIGGRTYARDGAVVFQIGNETETKTEIAIGVDPAILAEAAAAERVLGKKREAAAKIREKVQPLMAQLKRLTPQQRERATELMYEADSLDAEVRQQEQKIRQNIAAHTPSDRPSLLIQGQAHAGTVVIFGDRMAQFRKARKGPLRVERRTVDRQEAIVVFDEISGVSTTLPTYETTQP